MTVLNIDAGVSLGGVKIRTAHGGRGSTHCELALHAGRLRVHGSAVVQGASCT